MVVREEAGQGQAAEKDGAAHEEDVLKVKLIYYLSFSHLIYFKIFQHT